MGIAMKVNMIVMLIMVGFAFGAQPLIGYNYGAENRERLRKIIRFDLCVELVFSVVCAGLLALCAPQIMGNFHERCGDYCLRRPDAAVFACFHALCRCDSRIYHRIPGRQEKHCLRWCFPSADRALSLRCAFLYFPGLPVITGSLPPRRRQMY